LKLNHLKISLVILPAIAVAFAVVLFNGCKKENLESNKETVENVLSDSTQNKEDLLSVICVGDMMLGSNYPTTASLPPDDGKFLLSDVESVLRDADITCGNLEGTLLDKGGIPKKCGGNSSANCISFRMPEHYAGYLQGAGFDFMNLANNHSGDMGAAGREKTAEVLEGYNIKFAGTFDYPIASFEVNGLKVGFAGFAPNVGTLSIHNLEKAAGIVEDLKKENDIVIVAFHGGAEGSGAQRVPKRGETYLGENRGDVYKFAHTVIDAGADLVYGHGPHVTRALELYNNKLIAYSLGNFCTYGKFGLAGALGLAPILKVYMDKSGNFVRGEIISIKQIKRGIPVIDDDKRVIRIIRNLTQTDFPDTQIDIDDDGIISLIN